MKIVYTVVMSHNVSLLMHSSLSAGGSTGLTFSESMSIDTIEGLVDSAVTETAVAVMTGIDDSSSSHIRTSMTWTDGKGTGKDKGETVRKGGYVGACCPIILKLICSMKINKNNKIQLFINFIVFSRHFMTEEGAPNIT